MLAQVDAATTAGAWIITAGTDTGVMKLCGRALSNNVAKNANAPDSRAAELPLIGIAPFGAITGRADLLATKGGVCTYNGPPPSRDGSPLNPGVEHSAPLSPRSFFHGREAASTPPSPPQSTRTS